ncbi:MAG: hypothetical protein VB877_16975, partial [Pirellulaceae bacterium]
MSRSTTHFLAMGNRALARNCLFLEKSSAGAKVGLNGCPIVIPGRHDCKQLKWLFCGQFNDLHLAFAQSTQKEKQVRLFQIGRAH